MWSSVANLLLRSRMAWWAIVYRGYRQRYDVAPDFRFNGAGIQLYGTGRIELGDGSYVGELCTLQAAPNEVVRVGRHCSISHNVRVYTSTAVADANFTAGPPPTVSGSVAIGDGAWIGANTYIGPGVTIGENAVVGANSVVTRSIPSSQIWGGVPARFIRVKVAP